MARSFSKNAKRRGTTILCLALLLTLWGVWGRGKALAQSRSASPSRSIKEKPVGSAITRAAKPVPFPESKRLRILAFRLLPGQDLRQGIEEFVKGRNIRAGFILTGVGSLRSATIRLADQKDPTTFAGKFEIVSLVGTMGQDGVHLHISIADGNGKSVGGHLVDGCPIYTTAEIVIGDAEGLTFSREQDQQTGYRELRIRRSGH